MSDLLTSHQLAESLGLSERTIRKWHSAGYFPAAINEGIVLRFDPEEVAAALKKRADRKQRKQVREHLPLAKNEPGMVPTY